MDSILSWVGFAQLAHKKNSVIVGTSDLAGHFTMLCNPKCRHSYLGTVSPEVIGRIQIRAYKCLLNWGYSKALFLEVDVRRISILTISLLWILGCNTSPQPECDGCVPPTVTIDTPDQDDLFCDGFIVEGTASDLVPGLASVTLYVDGVEVETVDLSGEALSYEFEFDVSIEDFLAYCEEVEIEVIATDGEGCFLPARSGHYRAFF
jgi:hypothetical protein